jgi:hypothetical protein
MLMILCYGALVFVLSGLLGQMTNKNKRLEAEHNQLKDKWADIVSDAIEITPKEALDELEWVEDNMLHNSDAVKMTRLAAKVVQASQYHK